MAQLRSEVITEAMLDELKLQGFADTPQNRLSFLMGLKEGWLEDPDESLEKTFYLTTITVMIAALKCQLFLK